MLHYSFFLLLTKPLAACVVLCGLRWGLAKSGLMPLLLSIKTVWWSFGDHFMETDRVVFCTVMESVYFVSIHSINTFMFDTAEKSLALLVTVSC